VTTTALTAMTAMTAMTTVRGVRVFELQEIAGENGRLVIAEKPAGLPFAATRIFTLMDIPAAEMRGTHAHRKCEQFLICVRGSVTAVVDDGTLSRELTLDRPTLGLYMPALTWGAQYNYSTDAVLVVLASDPYDAADYIEDYNEFLKLVMADSRDKACIPPDGEPASILPAFSDPLC
jgi:UDP-2-acetamido-3-amino-2,3-dideoxy-glucuronate N-acetyltransferase